jgi:tRNA(fMet)-specific endonuclease VapC
MAFLIDTDILSAVMRRNADVSQKSRIYLEEHHRFHFSLITRYEILRGLKTKGAHRQIEAFEKLCSRSIVFQISDAIILKASDIYADLSKRGELIGDADILIAATALTHGFGVVTNNERHFQRITNLQVVNWLK